MCMRNILNVNKLNFLMREKTINLIKNNSSTSRSRVLEYQKKLSIVNLLRHNEIFLLGLTKAIVDSSCALHAPNFEIFKKIESAHVWETAVLYQK